MYLSSSRSIDIFAFPSICVAPKTSWILVSMSNHNINIRRQIIDSCYSSHIPIATFYAFLFIYLFECWCTWSYVVMCIIVRWCFALSCWKSNCVCVYWLFMYSADHEAKPPFCVGLIEFCTIDLGRKLLKSSCLLYYYLLLEVPYHQY